jgi:hypothetical protein
MPFVYTIPLAHGELGKRTATSRLYSCCIVATATEETIRQDVAMVAKERECLAKAEAKLAELTAKTGLTPEQAAAEYKAIQDRWYKDENGFFPTQKRITNERLAKGIGTSFSHFSEDRDQAEAELEAAGVVNPYKAPAREVTETAHSVSTRRAWLAQYTPVKLGEQDVVSWHRDTALAMKALGSRTAEWKRKGGYTLAVRTDIAVREPKKRAPKAATTAP